MASLWSRFKSGVSRLNNAIRGEGVGAPPLFQLPYEPPSFPAEPGGGYGDIIYTPPEETYDEFPDWFGNEITIENAYSEPFSHTKEEWFSEVLESKEYLLDKYGLDNLEIIFSLEDAGYWDDDDWDEWRSLYDSVFG